MFVKPSCGGSSSRSASVVDAADLAAAVYAAASEGHPALVERMMWEEDSASVLEDKVLPLIKITVAGGYYDYHAKYIAEDTLFECPCVCPKKKKNIWPLWRFVVFKRWLSPLGSGGFYFGYGR